MVIATPFVVLGVLQIVPFVLNREAAAPPAEVGPRLAAEITVDDLPDRVGGWRRIGFERIWRQERHALDLGNYSDHWTYRNRALTAGCSLDYPFAGWHDLRVCYRGQGWTIRDVRLELLDDRWSTCLIEMDLQRSPVEFAYVSFVVFDPTSRSIPPYFAILRMGAPSWDVLRSLLRRRLNRFGVMDYVSYQFQTFTISDQPLSEFEKKETRALFVELLKQIRPRVLQKQDG